MPKSHLLVCFVYLLISTYSFCQETQFPLSESKAYFTNNEHAFKCHQKVEIAIILPWEIEQKVEQFIASKGERGLNPYLDWELKVSVEFHQTENQLKDTIDAFYYKEYKRIDLTENADFKIPTNGVGYTDEEYQNLGLWEEQAIPFSFLARFVPRTSGKWSYRYFISTNNNVNFQSEWTSFEVLENIENPFIEISQSNRYLSLNKKPFIPIGCNASWPETKMEFDPQFAKLNQYITPSGEKAFIPENYRSGFVAPRVYRKYNEQILQMNEAGANWFRIIQFPTATEIEFEQLGNYTNRLYQASELDRLVELAEQHQFYLQWCMAIHFTFKNKVYGISHWDWDDQEGKNVYAYKTAFDLENPVEFFQHPEAKKYYKQRLRYILSRWGYSSQIGLFEILSEINNVGSAENESNSEYEKNVEIFQQWQDEMAAYIKSHYLGKQHLLTSSYSGMKSEKDKSYLYNDDFDVMGSNIYQYTWDANSSFFSKYVGENLLNQANNSKIKNYTITCEKDTCIRLQKPLIFSESEPIEMRHSNPQATIELNRHLWQSYFSGVAANLPWTIWYSPNNYNVFAQITKLFKSQNINWDDFHPGFMTNTNLGWEYNQNAAELMNSKNSKADLIYLRSNDLTQAVGIISNKTINYFTEENIENKNNPILLNQKEIVNLRKENIEVIGLKPGNYEIQYYLVNQIDQPIYIQKTSGRRIRFNYANLRHTTDTYLLFFKIFPKI